MAKRRRFSRWRRLPGVYRFGDDKPTDPNLEPQRLTLYVPGTTIDQAELQAVRLGFDNAQDYCSEIVMKAVEDEHVREHMADVEAKRGPLEGLQEIAEDAEYLTEFREASRSGKGTDRPVPSLPTPPTSGSVVPIFIEDPEPDDAEQEIRFIEPTAPVVTEKPRELVVRYRDPEPQPSLPQTYLAPSAAAGVILQHAGMAGEDPSAFLPSLRAGQSVDASRVAELAQALAELEQESNGAAALERSLSFALHRLAYESQILNTDAWPGVFDVWTVNTIRAVQEAVERILSGQDIRYNSDPTPDGIHQER